jgi:hypothetical protein
MRGLKGAMLREETSQEHLGMCSVLLLERGERGD